MERKISPEAEESESFTVSSIEELQENAIGVLDKMVRDTAETLRAKGFDYAFAQNLYALLQMPGQGEEYTNTAMSALAAAVVKLAEASLSTGSSETTIAE